MNAINAIFSSVRFLSFDQLQCICSVTAVRPVRRFAHLSYELGLPFIRAPFQRLRSQRQAGLPPVESWFRVPPWFRDEALLAISTDWVLVLIYRAFGSLFERIRLIKRHPDRDTS
jgi:hypothetical protein